MANPGVAPSGQPLPDIELEFYKLHRAHEVALNNATGVYEQAVLRLALIVNAASAGGFLALLQSVDADSSIRYVLETARLAILCWTVGVAAAFAATWLAYRSQRSFTRAFLNRRRAIEVRRAQDSDWPETYGIELKPSEAKYREKNADASARNEAVKRLWSSADTERALAAYDQSWAIGLGVVAVIASVIGLLLALSSIAPRP